MARFQHGRDAGGAQHGVEARVAAQKGVRHRILRIGHDGTHGLSGFAAGHRCHAAEEGAVGVVQLHRKLVVAHPVHGPDQVVDGVVRNRPRTVTAGIGHLEDEGHRRLLRRQHRVGDPLARGVQLAASPFVQGEAGVDQVPMPGRQEFRPVHRGAVLAAGQGHLQRPAGLVAGLAVADQRVGPDRGLRLVVKAAPGVEIAALLHQGERVACPVLALGRHHVDVGQQQHGLGLRVPARIDHHQVAVLGMVRRLDQVKGLVREPRRPHPRGHPFGRHRAAARRTAGVGVGAAVAAVATSVARATAERASFSMTILLVRVQAWTGRPSPSMRTGGSVLRREGVYAARLSSADG